jgi:hypothetical protein
MVVTSATSTRNAVSIRAGFSPLAAATSGTVDDRSSGRNSAPTAIRHSAPMTRQARTSLLEIPNIWPKSRALTAGSYALDSDRNRAPRASMVTIVRAVATSWRPRRPRAAIASAPTTEKSPRPSSVLAPIIVAPAAPAKAPLGRAWAAKADPRSTTKKLTTPATTATALPAAQVWAMRGLNI